MHIYARKLSKKRTAVMIRESYRENGKGKTRILKYFGISHSDEELKKLKEKAYYEKKKLEGKIKSPIKAKLSDLKEKARITEGFHDVFEKLFDELGLKKCFSKIKYNQLKDVIIARMANPCSKLQTSNILQKDFQKELSTDQIYHLMDKMVEKEEEIKSKIFENTQKLSSNKPTNLLLFDVTTLYFESQKSNELKEFGYSKDGKKGEVQVVLALATNEQGLSIGYHLFPGNTAEVKTLLQSLSNWKKIIPIKKIRIVADRAMMSDENLSEIENSKNQYVVAAKLKKIPKELRSKILKINKPISESAIEELTYKGRRVIIEYSPKRALKDRADRDRLIQKIKTKIGTKSKTRKLVTNNGYLKYMDDEKEGRVIFNEDKEKEEELWDGIHGIITNDFDAKAEELLSQYKRLWVIEESFRINKHSLSMRPIYHYTPRRIKSHILICYIAFSLYRSLQMKLKINGISMSLEKLRENLHRVQSSIFENPKNNKMYKMPSTLSDEVKQIYKMLKIHRSNKAQAL